MRLVMGSAQGSAANYRIDPSWDTISGTERSARACLSVRVLDKERYLAEETGTQGKA